MMGNVRLTPEASIQTENLPRPWPRDFRFRYPGAGAALIFRGIPSYVVDLVVGDEGLEPPTPSV
jgi:hypothetical protein